MNFFGVFPNRRPPLLKIGSPDFCTECLPQIELLTMAVSSNSSLSLARGRLTKDSWTQQNDPEDCIGVFLPGPFLFDPKSWFRGHHKRRCVPTGVDGVRR